MTEPRYYNTMAPCDNHYPEGGDWEDEGRPNPLGVMLLLAGVMLLLLFGGAVVGHFTNLWTIPQIQWTSPRVIVEPLSHPMPGPGEKAD